MSETVTWDDLIRRWKASSGRFALQSIDELKGQVAALRDRIEGLERRLTS